MLGRPAPPVPAYSPDILEPIERASGRGALPAQYLDGMHGQDVWHAYELSWLDASGRPSSRIGRLVIPSEAPRIPESKSFKLYLNSLNGERLGGEADFRERVVADLERLTGAPVRFSLYPVDSPDVAGVPLRGQCIDGLEAAAAPVEPASSLLEPGDALVSGESLHSHLFRSLCPVTGQPDWATVRVTYSGAAIAHASLLRYLLSFREHQAFHEQCVERIYCDIAAACAPQSLTVEAFFARRGGLDINPVRSSLRELPTPCRLIRQ